MSTWQSGPQVPNPFKGWALSSVARERQAKENNERKRLLKQRRKRDKNGGRK